MYSPYSCVHIEVVQIIRRFPIINLSYDREDFLHVINIMWWYTKMMWPNSKFLGVLNLLNLREFLDFLNILDIQFLQVLLCLWQNSHDNSETSDPCLLLQVFLCLWTVEHPFATLENSTLRRDWNFDLRLHQVSLTIQPVDSKLWVSPGTDEELAGTELVKFIAVGLDFATILFSSYCSCIHFAILFGAVNQNEILGTAKRAEILYCQYVCKLVFGVDILDLNFGVQCNSVKQPIQTNSVGSWHMSHCGTSDFDYHLNNGISILKDIQHSIGTRMCPAWWNVNNTGQIDIGVRGWNLFSLVWLRIRRQVSPWLSYTFGFVGLVPWRMKYFSNKILQ